MNLEMSRRHPQEIDRTDGWLRGSAGQPTLFDVWGIVKKHIMENALEHKFKWLGNVDK